MIGQCRNVQERPAKKEGAKADQGGNRRPSPKNALRKATVQMDHVKPLGSSRLVEVSAFHPSFRP